MSGCQVIMLSGMGGTREIRDAMNAGAVEYLKKPFSPLELIGMVEKVLHEPVNKV
jgi:DNA-binding NtrC family response regulator